MVSNEKRSTRSQMSIADYFVPLDLSPLKQARSAMRNADAIVATDSPDVGSSTGVTSGKKRSASPLEINREESVEREMKRSKTSTEENKVNAPSPSGWKLQIFPSVLPPPSVSGSTTPARSVGSSPRARSVPPSIPTTPGQIPYLDLSKYRSPTKSVHRVRMMSVPPSSPSVRDGEEGAGVGKGVDRDLERTPVPRMVVEKVEKIRRNLGHPLPALVIASTSSSQKDDPFSLEPDALLKTPVQKARPLPESMSPLTPLGSLDLSSQSPPLTSLPLPPNGPAATDPMNVDPPPPPPSLQPQTQVQPQPQPDPPSEQKPDPRAGLTKRSSHLIPPQPKPLSFRLPSRSPTPPSQRVSRSRSVSVDPPIPALPYPLLPSTSNPSNSSALQPEPEPEIPVSPIIPDPQPPETRDLPEVIPSALPLTPAEIAVPAPVLLNVPDRVELDEKGKGKPEDRAPEPSKLPVTKPIKVPRFRSTIARAGPSGVTRTRATKVAVRPTPISRERRVTRSSTAKTREADELKEKEDVPTDLITKPNGSHGEGGKVEKEGKHDSGIGTYLVRSSSALGCETDTRVSLSVFVNPTYTETTEVDGFHLAHCQLASKVKAFLPY